MVYRARYNKRGRSESRLQFPQLNNKKHCTNTFTRPGPEPCKELGISASTGRPSHPASTRPSFCNIAHCPRPVCPAERMLKAAGRFGCFRYGKAFPEMIILFHSFAVLKKLWGFRLSSSKALVLCNVCVFKGALDLWRKRG
jgi:hypothetical protein